MASVIQAVVFVGDTSKFLLLEVASGLMYLMARNYELVSFLIQILMECCNGIRNVAAGIYWALHDFVDQYGEFCVMVIKGVWNSYVTLMHWIVCIVQLICNVLLTFVNGLYCILKSPLLFCQVIYQANCAIIDWITSIPGRSIDLVLDGFSLLGTLIIDTTVWLVCTIGRCICEIFTEVWFFLGFGVKSILQKKPVSGELLNTVADGRNATMEGCVGVTVCLISYIIFSKYPGWLRNLRRKLWITCFTFQGIAYLLYRQFSRRFRRRLRRADRAEFRQSDQPLRRVPLNTRSSDRSVSSNTTLQSNRNNGPSNQDTISERSLCTICQDKEKTVMVEDCNHLCMCRNCAEAVFRTQRRCPICRALIIRLIDVYW